MACVTLPVFFYNHPQRPGEVLSLHLFEPRYREMIRRGHKQFLYHPVGTGAASVGDIGMVARIDELQVQPDGRAYLEAMITHPVVVLAHFVEPGSGGLAFAVCSAPTPDAHMLLDRGKQIRALNRFTSVRTFCRSSKNGRYRVHTQRGFLNVHLRNDDPFETSNIIGQLQDGDVVTVSGELGPAPFFWAKLEQPAGYCVSCTGNFEWLEPEEPRMSEFQIRLSFTSLTCLVTGTKEEVEAATLKIATGTNLSPAELRIQPIIRPSGRLVTLDSMCKELALIVESNEFDRYLVGLPVAKCFEMFVADAGARIGQLVVATNARVARSLVLTWMENFEREMVHANESQKAIWTRLCESPDGNLNKQLFPYAVAVAFGSAKLIVHREFCFLDEQMALSVLRKASLVRHWPALRLLYIAMTDSNSLISHLPIEIISCVGKSISPHLFMKRISNSDH